MAVGVAVLPVLLIVAGALAASDRTVLMFAAVGVGVLGDPASTRLPIEIGPSIWAADLIVLAAVASWLLAWLTARPDRRPRLPHAPVLAVTFGLFAIALIIGAWRGHERYGAPFIGMPMRLVVYAGIMAAMGGSRPRRLFAVSPSSCTRASSCSSSPRCSTSRRARPRRSGWTSRREASDT